MNISQYKDEKEEEEEEGGGLELCFQQIKFYLKCTKFEFILINI